MASSNIKNSSGVSYDMVIRELIEEQNEMQDIILDLLEVISVSHPEITLKYAGFGKKWKEFRK